MKTAAKDFKMTELGPIPKDWEVKCLQDVADTASGGTPSRAVSDFYNGSIKWFTTTELKDGDLGDSAEHINDAAVKSSSARIFPSGTLLMAMYGATIGRLGILTDDAATNQACCAIFCNNCDAKYLFYALLYDRERIVSLGSGAGQPNISQQIVKCLAMSFPPLPEQRKIAAALSDVDEMIAALEKLIEKKRKIKTGAMQRLLAGKTRLPGFKGAWVEKRLGDCAEVFCDGDWIESADQSDSGIRLVQTGNVGEGVFLDKSDKKRFVSEATFKRLNCCEIFAGDVLVSRLPDPAGRACLLSSSSERRITAVDCTIIRFNDLLAAEYFVAFSQTAGYYKQIDEQMAGSTRQRISRKALGDVVVSCPPTLAEQKAIAKVLGDMDEEIAALEAELAKTRQLKQGMMQELLTGKVRLV